MLKLLNNNKIIIKQILFIGVVFSMIILSVIIILTEFRFPFHGSDSGFYLSIIREMNLGSKYFTEIASPYSPLAITILGIPSFLFGIEGKLVAFSINIIFMMASSVLIYRVLMLLNNKHLYSIVFSVLFFLLSLNYDGHYIVLEPITVFFQLFSFYFFIKYTIDYNNLKFLFYSGILLGFGFLSKQYAIFLLFPFYYYLFIIESEKKIKKIVLFTLAFFLPTILLYLLFYTEINFINYLYYLSGTNMDVDIQVSSATGSNYKPFMVSTSKLIKLISTNFYVFLIPLYLVSIKKIDVKKIVFYFLVMFSSISVLFFADYDHYFHFIFSFVIIFVGFIKMNSQYKNSFIYIIPICISIFFLAKKTRNNFPDIMKKNNTHQNILGIKVKELVPEESQVFLDGFSPKYYYINNWRSINLKKVGFLFSDYLNPNTIITAMKKNSYLILSDKRKEKYKEFYKFFDTIGKINYNKEKYLVLKKVYE
tara:strand:+ start:25508 stop:26944 length:1437 start_codon:yes stop_codon:yes gene_type:complete